MSDTPKTEAEVNRQKCWSDDLITIDANFACQLERELNSANAEVERLTAKVAQLYEGAEEQKHQIQTLKWDLDANRNTCSRKNDRIRHLIRLGLATTRPEALDQWQEEEEL